MAVAAGERVADPGAETIAGLLHSPPTPAEVIAHVEPLVLVD